MSFEDWQEISHEKQERIHKLVKMYNTKEIKMFDLTGYTPEKVKDNDFEPINGKDFVCRINSSKIEQVEGGKDEKTGREWESYNRLKYEMEIIDDKGKGFKGRKVWKSYNLDSDKASGKAQKTPIQKLADVFFTIGLEFNDMDSLEKANEKFADMILEVSFNSFKGDDGRDVQMHTIKGVLTDGAEEKVSAPSF